MRKNVIIRLMLFILMLGSSQVINVYADQQSVEIVEGLTVDEDSAVPLYNNEDDISAYYIEGDDNGYVIIDDEGNVVEFSYQGSIHEIEESNTDCYYGGPGNYYVEADDDSDILLDISSDDTVDKDDIETFDGEDSTCEDKCCDTEIGDNGLRKKSATITLPDGINYSDGKRQYTHIHYNTLTLKSKNTLPYHSRYFSYNYNSTCGSTAAAILIYYYFDHVDKSYIKTDKYKKGDITSQKALVKRFQKLLGDNGNGTTNAEVRNGINRYLKSIGKKGSCKYISKYNVIHSVISKIKNRINNKRPCIVGLEGEPEYKDHWCVGIGYASYYGINGHSRGYVHFIKINNGWGNSFSKNVVYVNYKYVDNVIYLK